MTRPIADIEADILRAMGSAASQRQAAEQCRAPEGRSDHQRNAAHFDRMASGYRLELEAAKTAPATILQRDRNFPKKGCERRNNPCPKCRAKAGVACKGPTGKLLSDEHVARWK